MRNSPERGLEIATDRLKSDPGDLVVIGNLSSIASKLLGDGNKWHDIYNANKGTIGPNPKIIKAGMKLVIP